MRVAIIGAVLLALGACSAVRLGYEQGPLLARWWLDRYLDFDAEQQPLVRQGLTQWFAWHRATQLEDYAGLLARAQEEVVQPLSPAQACAWGRELRSRALVAAEAMLPHAARVAVRLEPAQIAHMEARMARRNDELRRKVVQSDRQERYRASVERTVERIEDFYGRLDASQKRLVEESLASSPFDADQFYAQRLVQQREILATLRRLATERPGEERAAGALRELMARLAAEPSVDPQSAEQRLLQHNCAFAARLHNATTPAQRQHLRRKLRGWQDDARLLSARAAP
ncbi:MAG: DUF6279 family lipoprotein [Rubrivivax sp.]